ncbi:ABC transporter ATP-binding protein [Gorillibacterium sp. sgz5001074]|uniref:ABC transporter ATP-binding protein n=1 Tax=Gorillibacterium sp. sgz5001074 TaxID=3446695 RepID=UPI003F664AFF
MSIRLQKVSRRFGSLRVLEEFSLSLAQGRIQALLGPSGCGKTTLLHLLAGLLKPESGSVEGTEGLSCSFVFQEDRLLPWATVWENVRFVLESTMSHEQAEEAARLALEQVGLTAFRNAYPEALSGGMKQRVSLARAMAFSGELLLMDEPYKGLDRELKLGLMEDLLSFVRRAGVTVLLVTHDVEEALLLADEVLLLQGPPLAVRRTVTVQVPHEDRRRRPELLEPYRKELLGN